MRSTRSAAVRFQSGKSGIDGQCHDRGLLRTLLARPYDDVTLLNARDMQHDAVLALVIHNAPGIAGVGVAALQGQSSEASQAFSNRRISARSSAVQLMPGRGGMDMSVAECL